MSSDPNPNLPAGVAGSSDSATSLSLIQRAQAGDPSAWDRLVKLYAPLAQHWCRRQGVTGADADDVVQEIFQLAYARIADFRRTQASHTLRGWLRGIARNKLLEFFRRQRRQPQAVGGSTIQQRIQEAPGPDPDADPDDAADADALNDLYARALDLVRHEFEPPTWRAFWRTTVDAQRPVDVAKELGLSPPAVRMAKSRVLRRIREELGELA